MVPAEKNTLSKEVVIAVRTGEPTFAPVESVLQNALDPQVPVGVVPAPAVPVPLPSQYRLPARANVAASRDKPRKVRRKAVDIFKGLSRD